MVAALGPGSGGRTRFRFSERLSPARLCAAGRAGRTTPGVDSTDDRRGPDTEPYRGVTCRRALR